MSSSRIENPRIPSESMSTPELFGGEGGGNSSTSPTIGQAVVGPSGQTIIVYPQDGSGNPTGVTALVSSSASQSIQLTGIPAGNAFTLAFEGQTTAPIATVTNPPSEYFLWTFPTVAGHSYNLAVNFYGDTSTPVMGFEPIIDGTVGTLTIVENSASLFTDPGVDNPGGGLTQWLPTVSSVAATDVSMSLRCTEGQGNIAVMAALRVQDTTAGTISYYSVASDTGNFSVVSGGHSISSNPNAYGGQEMLFLSSGIGPYSVVAPGTSGAATVLQNALQALSTIGRGGITVTDNSGTASGNYTIDFVGGLANAAQPLITCADPAVSIAQIAAGGGGPSLTLNGRPIALEGWVWSEGDPLPYAMIPLPQSAPASQVGIVNMLPFFIPNGEGGWNGQISGDASSLSGNPAYAWGAGSQFGFQFEELPPATYEFLITYPNTPFNRPDDNTNYSPSTATQFLVQDAFGDTLATYTIDQTQPLTDYVDSSGRGWKALGSFTTTPTQTTLTLLMTTVGQSAASSGQTQYVAILDAVLFNRTSPDVSVTIGATDVATLSIPAGWMTTQAGAISAIPSLAVSPPASILPAFDPSPKTMKVGYNIEGCGYASDMITHSNLAYLIPTLGSVQDANGYPTRFVSPYGNELSSGFMLNNNELGQGDPPWGSYFINPGLFIMLWDGDETISIASGASTTTVTELTEYQILTGTTGNRRVYNIQFNPLVSARPQLQFVIASSVQDLVLDPTGITYVTNLTNLRIYPPDPSDSTGNTIWGLDTETGAFTPPPRFHPWFTYKLQGMQGIRDLDLMNTNNNGWTLASQIKPDTHANRCSAYQQNVYIPLAKIQAAASNQILVPTVQPQILVTTSAPHGVSPGWIISFDECGTIETTNSAVAYSGGSYAKAQSTQAIVLEIIDDLNFTAILYFGYLGNLYPQPPGPSMSNVLTPTGASLVIPGIGTGWSLEDFYALFEECPWLNYWHHNVPPTIDVSSGGAAYQHALAIAQNLRAGVTVSFEFGNECWNSAGICNPFCCYENAKQTGQPFTGQSFYQTWYADQTKAYHQQCLAAFEAAGRAADMKHLYGSFANSPGTTSLILARAQSTGATVDEVCIAVYYQGCPFVGYSADQLPVFDAMTVDQLLDYQDLNAVYGHYPEYLVANQYPVLQQYGYNSATVVAYEGSPGVLVPLDPPGSPPGNTPNFSTRQNAMRRHPRQYANLLTMAQGFQDAGLTRWSYFHLGSEGNYYTWNSYEYGNQQRGTGTESASSPNVANPVLLKNECVNEWGGAFYTWGTLVAAPTPIKTPTRNGALPAKGLRTGLARRTHV